jgi:hypothetical protein
VGLVTGSRDSWEDASRTEAWKSRPLATSRLSITSCQLQLGPWFRYCLCTTLDQGKSEETLAAQSFKAVRHRPFLTSRKQQQLPIQAHRVAWRNERGSMYGPPPKSGSSGFGEKVSNSGFQACTLKLALFSPSEMTACAANVSLL